MNSSKEVHNPKLQLKNFRVFGEEGSEFEMAPITILTGCNSSGKSSVIKSLMLLQDFLTQIMIDFRKGKSINLENYELNFMNAKHNLGAFDNAINKFSESKTITIACTKYSLFFNGEIDICFEFIKNEDNVINSGKLKSLKISCKNTPIFTFDGLKKDYYCDLFSTKSYFLDFIKEVKEYNRQSILIDQFKVDFERNKGEKFDLYKHYEILHHFELENKFNEKEIANYEAFTSLNAAKKFNYDKLFERELNYGSLFNLPVLKWLENVEKKQVSEVLFNLCKEHSIDENLEVLILRIVENFKDSKFNYFIDYYRNYEDLFLESICYGYNTHGSDPESFSFYSNILNGINDADSTFGLRGILLSINPRWTPHGIENEIYWDEIGGDDFDREHHRFKIIYKTMLEFSCFVNTEFRESVGIKDNKKFFGNARAKDFEVFLLFFSHFVYDSTLNLPSFINNVEFVGSERINVNRLYTKEQNTEFTELLFELVKVCDKTITDYIGMTFTKKWLKKFEIADDVKFVTASEGLGLFVYLIKGDEKRLLADEGFGISKLLVILFKIELHIIKAHQRQEEMRDGYRNLSFSSIELCTIVIEEPESNLHPKLQSLLADMLVELAFNKNGNGARYIHEYKILNGFKFIIETHSEYLIRKLQTLVARKEIKPGDVSIEYIYHPDPNKRPEGKQQVEKINIDEDGALNKPFGGGFFDEASSSTLELIRLKRQGLN
jgi:AAA ATPase domain/Protein of unknown function (DUF3696)